MQKSFLSRENSNAIKGVALISMFVHHFFTIPEWYVEGVSYPYLGAFAQYLYAPLKMCIPVFAFLTGYFYWFAARKNLRYSLRKATDLLVSHWIVCICMTLLAVVLGCYAFTPGGFVIEMMGQSLTVMRFSWYVLFYCISMLLLPLLDRLSTGTLAGDIFVLLVLPVAGVVCLMVTMEAQLHLNLPMVFAVMESVREWLPCVVSGFLFAKYALFETYLDGVTARFSGRAGRYIFWICLCGIGFFGRLALPRFQLGSIHPAGTWTQLLFTMDILYAPMLVYGMAGLLDALRLPAVIRVLGALGKRSMYMWFLHGMFFNCCASVLQPLIYAPRNPVLVLLLALALCYGLALVMDLAVKPVLTLKNKYL